MTGTDIVSYIIAVICAGKKFQKYFFNLSLLSFLLILFEKAFISPAAGLRAKSIISPAMFTYENPYLA